MNKHIKLSDIENILHNQRMLLRAKIINLILQSEKQTIEFDLDELDEPTHVYWTNGKGESYEVPVLAIGLDDKNLIIKVETEFSLVSISEVDGNLALRCHEWLIGIIYNMCQTLNIDPETL